MDKRFNVTGKCIADQHYMADVSGKLAQGLKLIEAGEYFIINRPRQYGKTTTLYSLASALRATGNYIVFNISFEGVGDSFFEDDKIFPRRFVTLLTTFARYYAPDMENWLRQTIPAAQDMQSLSDIITDLVNRTDKKMVLMIDEVDKSSNNQLFVSFLAMLRDKYLVRDIVKTFHSVVLAGVHDVKSLKLKLRPDEEQKYNSPWNIAADYTVDMNLQPFEIKPMLEEYCRDKNVVMDIPLIAERLFYYTSGYPFLVSKLCKMLDEIFMPAKNIKEWTGQDLDAAVVELTKENNTNFETLAKNIQNNKKLYELVYYIAVDSEQIAYNNFDPTINFALLYGIVARKNNALVIHNRIYQEVLLDYMTTQMHMKQLNAGADSLYLGKVYV